MPPPDRRHLSVHDYYFDVETELQAFNYPVNHGWLIHSTAEDSPKEPYLGVELEVECVEFSSRWRWAVAKYALLGQGKKWHRHLGAKTDASLRFGIEFVSHPHTLRAHKRILQWGVILKRLRETGCTSHDPGTCGLHVHISKAHIPESVQVKMGYVVNRCRNLMRLIARRDQNGYCQWVNKRMARGQNANLNDRYEAVNFLNTHTIEFRLWRGTLDEVSFMACVEFTHAIWAFCMTTSASAILKSPTEKLLLFVRQHAKEYPSLYSSLLDKGAYHERNL